MPGNEYWLTRLEGDPDKHWSYFFIRFIWVIMMFNTVLTLVVLLNFLIAIVSESYARSNES